MDIFFRPLYGNRVDLEALIHRSRMSLSHRAQMAQSPPFPGVSSKDGFNKLDLLAYLYLQGDRNNISARLLARQGPYNRLVIH